MKKFLVFLIALFMFGITVKADCLEKEYLDWSYDLKPVFTVFNYNEHQDLDIEKYKYAYFLSLSKQRDDITFTVTDKYNNTVPASDYEELKLYAVGLYNGVDEESYKINVYGTAKGTCANELITTLEYTVPAYNEYYKTQYCDKYKEHELCQVFTNATKGMTRDEFNTIMKEYDEGKNKGLLKVVLDFLGKAWIYIVCILVPVIGVSIYYNIKIKRYKKMRNRNEVRRKNKHYIFVFLLLICLTTVKVNASLTCGDATIKETGITSAGWATRMIMCDFYDTGRVTVFGSGGTTSAGTTGGTPNWKEMGTGYGSMGDAVQAGKALVAQTVYSADGKSASEILVPMCLAEKDTDPGKKWTLATKTCTCNVHDTCTNPDTNETYDCITGTEDCSTHNLQQGEDAECTACTGDVVSESDCTKEYYITCPIYACSPVEKTIEGWCNAKFKVGSDDAYCVNPSDKFPHGIPNNYQTQKFDPTTCSSSTDTPDCGFANILIEAAYYNQNHPNNKISYETINFALRLWSGEVQLGGFYRVGLAYMMGYGCSEYVAYPAGNPNVYLASLEYITRLYFEAISREGVDHSVESLINNNYFSAIACKPGQLGVVCHGRTDTYVQAFALYFNTYFGNDFRNHLAALYGGRETEPISATVSSEVIDEYSVVEVKYREEVTIGEKIECSDIKAKKASGAALTEDEQKVLNYCNNQITHVIGVRSDGTMIDLATKTIVTDLNGDGVINAKDFLLLPQGETYDFTYCQKNSCFSPTVYFAICDTVKKEEERYETIYTTIRYTESGSRYSIKKYLACGSGDYQIMFSYDEDEGPTNIWEETTPTVLEPTKTVTVDFYCYDEGGCNNYMLRQEEQCARASGGHGSLTVKDPSLSCIVNMQSTVAKNSYDYSSFFGVNSDFCKIYCSDSAEFYMADKVDIYSGLSFKLDIEYDLFKSNKTSRAISNVVLMRRDCVSKIFYDNNNFESGTDWTQKYSGLSSNPKNWKELHAALKKYGLAAGHINQIEYDLYNCNLYSNIPVYRPKDNKIGNVYNRIKEIYSAENSYGFNGDKYGYNFDSKLSDTENNIIYSDVKYGGGALYVNSKNRVGAEYGDIKLNYMINNHNKYSGNVSPVTYCKGTKCFAYDKEGDEYKMPDEYGSGAGRVISTAQGSGIPTNDYAYFSIVNEIDFYNDSKFQVETYTGNIFDATNKEKDADYTDLDKYLFPVAKDANVECKGDKCNIDYRYNILQTYYRKMGTGTNTFRDTIKSITHTCPVEYKAIPLENKNEAIYRNVDISNLFPTTLSDGSRRIGANWQNSTAYIEEIENYVKGNGEVKYYETHLEYSYTLTADAMKKIKEYNSQSAGSKSYVDNSIEKGSCVDANGKKFDCRTRFISTINSNTNSYGVVNNRQGQERGVSEYTADKKDED